MFYNNLSNATSHSNYDDDGSGGNYGNIPPHHLCSTVHTITIICHNNFNIIFDRNQKIIKYKGSPVLILIMIINIIEKAKEKPLFYN